MADIWSVKPELGSTVSLFVVENFFFRHREGVGVVIVLLIKATPVSGVTGATDLLDFEEQDVLIAVSVPAFDFLRVAAGFALEPELLTRAAPVVHEAGFEGLFEGFAVHPREHENASTGAFAFGSFLGDDGDQSVGGKFEVEFHCCKDWVSWE